MLYESLVLQANNVFEEDEILGFLVDDANFFVDVKRNHCTLRYTYFGYHEYLDGFKPVELLAW